MRRPDIPATRTLAALAALTALTALAAVPFPAPAAAQEGGSIFTLLDTDGRRLAGDEESTGELTSRDYLAGGRRVQAWAVDAEAGQALQFDMVSDDFDTYLYLAGPGIGEVSDDDSGEGVNARLCVEFPESGTYRVVASSYGDDTGAFSLRAESRATCADGAASRGSEVADLGTLDTGGRSVPWNGEAAGTLRTSDPVSFGAPVQAWAVEGRAGESLTIDLFSTDFDAYLTVLGPGLPDWITNDDGAGGCNSRVNLTFPEDGTYRAIVSSVSGTAGGFTLATYEDPPVPRTGRCVPAAVATPESAGAIADLAARGSVAIGSAVTGSLTEGAIYQNRPAERWTLEARRGQELAIQQTSDEIDSYLYFQGPGFAAPLSSDDVDGTLNSRICVTIPEDGTYDIVSAAFSSTGYGPYRLAVAADPDGEICDDFAVSLQSGFGRIPIEGRALASGDEVAGALDPATDERHPTDGSLVDVYAVEAEAGESLVIDLASEAFDAFMYLLGPGLTEPIVNDDGGGRCNARVDLVAPASGTYRVVVNTYSEAAAGAYTLRVSAEAPPLAEGPCVGSPARPTSVSSVAATTLDHVEPEAGRALPVGHEVTGELTDADPTIEDGKRAQAWSLELDAGETVIVELLSDDFDPYLYLTGPGLPGVLADDDGGPGTNARITFTANAGGGFRVVVSSFSADATGAFQLRAIRRADARGR